MLYWPGHLGLDDDDTAGRSLLSELPGLESHHDIAVVMRDIEPNRAF